MDSTSPEILIGFSRLISMSIPVGRASSEDLRAAYFLCHDVFSQCSGRSGAREFINGFRIKCNEVLKKAKLFVFGQVLETKIEDGGFDLIQALFAEIPDADQLVAGDGVDDLFYLKDMLTLQCVHAADGELKLVDVHIADGTGKCNADLEIRSKVTMQRPDEAVDLFGLDQRRKQFLSIQLHAPRNSIRR